uniref:KIB1-4 beta-propeller domain-containing protein n=1 Tax=Oryza barthii TaxID=65489 RepID=A0A0D3F069_9ORYZ
MDVDDDDARPTKRPRAAGVVAIMAGPPGGDRRRDPRPSPVLRRPRPVQLRLPPVAPRRRRAPRRRPPPPLPWLVSCYKGAFDSLPYGDRHYLALDSPACLACDGGWLLFDRRAAAAVAGGGGGGYLLKKPISKAAMELPGSLSGPPAATAEMKICKLVVMSRDLVAAIVSTSGGGGGRAVALCRPGTSPSWSAHHPPGGADHQLGDLRDIAVHGGKLYALHGHGNLCSYDLIAGDGEPKVSSCVHHIAGDALPPNKLPEEHDAGHHLVPSATGGELLLVRHLYSRFLGRHFTVFVADVGGARWSEAAASSLRDQLIFVGTGCSRALTASHYGGVGAMRGNRVFYTNDVEGYSSTHSYLVYDMIMRSNGPVFPIYDDDYLHEGKRRYRYEDTRYRSWFFPSSV